MNGRCLLSAAFLLIAQALPAVMLERGRTEVVVAPDTPKTIRFAAMELTNFLARAMACDVPVVTAPTEGAIPVFLGDSRWTREAGIDVERFPRDGFAIRADAHGVFIAGRDDPSVDAFVRVRGGGVANLLYERATLFGVYEFLERHVGVRFYFPGELGTCVPRVERVEVPEGLRESAPDFTVRRWSFFWDGEWFEPPEKGCDAFAARTLNCYRLRAGTVEIRCSHGQNGFAIPERFAATHPDYFQLRADGSRCLATESSAGCVHCRQLCQSSGVWDEFYRDCAACLRGEDPAGRGILHWRPRSRVRGEFAWPLAIQRIGSSVYIDVMPQDGMKPCHCARCQSAYRAASNPRSPASELVWGRTAELARRLSADGLNATLVQMAYGDYAGIPALQLPTNILVMVAKRGPWGIGDRSATETDNADIAAWNAKTGRKVWLWNYPCKVASGGRLLPDVPQMAPCAWGAYYRAVAPFVIGAYAESNSDRAIYNYLNYYVFSRIAWDVRTDVGAVIAEHHVKMFGVEAAPFMARFYDCLERKWMDDVSGKIVETSLGPQTIPPSDHRLWFEIYSPAVIAELKGLLAGAERRTRTGSIEARRVGFVREQFLVPLAKRAADYVERHSVGRALARAAARPAANLLKDRGWRNAESFRSADCALTGSTSFKLVATSGRANLYHPLADSGVALKPGTRYRLSCFVKCVGLKPRVPGGGAVATVTLPGGVSCAAPSGNCPSGDTDWEFVECEFRTGDDVGGLGRKDNPIVALRIRNADGVAYFDSVRLEEP